MVEAVNGLRQLENGTSWLPSHFDDGAEPGRLTAAFMADRYHTLREVRRTVGSLRRGAGRLAVRRGGGREAAPSTEGPGRRAPARSRSSGAAAPRSRSSSPARSGSARGRAATKSGRNWSLAASCGVSVRRCDGWDVAPLAHRAVAARHRLGRSVHRRRPVHRPVRVVQTGGTRGEGGSAGRTRRFRTASRSSRGCRRSRSTACRAASPGRRPRGRQSPNGRRARGRPPAPTRMAPSRSRRVRGARDSGDSERVEVEPAVGDVIAKHLEVRGARAHRCATIVPTPRTFSTMIAAGSVICATRETAR